MHKRTPDALDRLKLVLQTLSDIMSLAQAVLGRHDNVHLDDHLFSPVVGVAGVHLQDQVGMSERQEDDLLHQAGRRSYAAELEELGPDRADPGGNDDQRDEHGARRVDPPLELGAGGRGEDGEAVLEAVVAVVLPQHLQLGAVLTKGEAVDGQEELDAEAARGGDDGGDFQLAEPVVLAREGADRLDDQDQRDGHQGEGEADVAGVAEAGRARGPAGRVVELLGFLVQIIQADVADGLAAALCHGDKEGQGSGRGGRIDLQGGDEDGAIDGNVDGGLDVPAYGLGFVVVHDTGCCWVFGHLNESVDVFILRRVVIVCLSNLAVMQPMAQDGNVGRADEGLAQPLEVDVVCLERRCGHVGDSGSYQLRCC